MSTITVIQSSDLITNSRAVINTNFSNLNTDKIETSYLDTDTTLAANSDSKMATQKAVKAYVDAGGNVNASETAKGIVEEATDTEVTNGSSTGGTGAKLFITPAKLATRLSTITSPVINAYTTEATIAGSSTTRFDITNPSGTTFRYTYDGTGTDPSFSAVNYPVGTAIYFNAQNFNSNNNGSFLVTGSGTNYVEVTNASGVAENDKTIGTGYIYKGVVWTKPTGLKYVEVELVGAGGGGGASTSSNGGGAGGGAGGYAKKVINSSSLGATVPVFVAVKGAGVANSAGTAGKLSAFHTHISATGGSGGAAAGGTTVSGGTGGVGTGTLSSNGGTGGQGESDGASKGAGEGGASFFGGYGALGSGGTGKNQTAGTDAGLDGISGAVIVTEYYV